MIASAVAFLRLIPPRMLFTGIAIVVALAAILWFIKSRENAAVERATSKIERANDAAKERFNDARDEVNRCYDGGGTWNRFERVCDKTSASH